MGLHGRQADEDTAMPLCDIWTDDYPAGIRVWPATKPVFDSSKRKERGTYGWHVHAYDENGNTPVNQTYERVLIDGVPIEDIVARAQKEKALASAKNDEAVNSRRSPDDRYIEVPEHLRSTSPLPPPPLRGIKDGA